MGEELTKTQPLFLEDLAKYLWHRCHQMAVFGPDKADRLKLINLLYLCEGWHLGITNESLYPEQVHAYKRGVLFPALEFSAPASATEVTKVESSLSDDSLEIITNVLTLYAKMDGKRLLALVTGRPNFEMTPFRQVWESHKFIRGDIYVPLLDETVATTVIPKTTIRDFFHIEATIKVLELDLRRKFGDDAAV